MYGDGLLPSPTETPRSLRSNIRIERGINVRAKLRNALGSTWGGGDFNRPIVSIGKFFKSYVNYRHLLALFSKGLLMSIFIRIMF